MLKRIVAVTEVLAIVAFVAFVALLLVKQPTSSGGSSRAAATVDGASLFAANCAGCHGSQGEGGVGPKLAGGRVTTAFADASRELTFIRSGSGVMPGFASTLTPEQLQAVVDYTRKELQQK